MRKSSLLFRVYVLLVVIAQLFSSFPVIAGSAPSVEETPSGNAQPTSQPVVLSSPLSISRAQSSYEAGTTTISYQITNNQPPTLLPDIPDGSAITDTMSILASFVVTDDVNTLHSAIVEDTLVNGTTLIEASGDPIINGDALTWELPSLPPQGTATITLTVQTPTAGSDFIEIDSGAQIDAEQWGQPVSAAATPALIIPNGIDPVFTSATPDADIYDADMLWKSATLDQDAIAAFEYVRGFGYDPYKGSLRGTRGTLWGEAGNAADQSSLLIAMLRAAGIPSRYRHGSLSTANAKTLIASMFPAPQGMAGSLPNNVEIANPVNDPDLIALVKDHWWVEAYLPGSGWTDFDPSFSAAQPGDVFATPGGDDRIAELPDPIRHKITVRLRVEQYSAFPIGGDYLTESIPLEETFPTAQVASKRLTFAHLVTGEGQGGVFANLIYNYTPYLAIEDNDISYFGDTFQDFISNFPLSTHFTTAEWLDYELEDPDGNVETFTRTVKDLIGVDARQLGGALDLSVGTDSPPFVLIDDLYVNWVLPNNVPAWVYERQHMNVLPKMKELGAYGAEMVEIVNTTPADEPLSPEDSQAVREARTAIMFANERLLTGIGLDFAWAADQAMAQISAGLQTKMYYQTPRVFTVASVGTMTEAYSTTVDLRHTTANTIVYPGQAVSAAFSANWFKGLTESELEGQALERVFGISPITTGGVFDEMEIQGIMPVLLTPNDFHLLEVYPFSPETKARLITALNAGKHVLIPGEPVSVDGKEVFAWWEFNPLTGETISVMDNGLHPAALPYRLVLIVVEACIDCFGGGGNPLSAGGSNVIEPATIIGQKLKGYFETLLEEWESAKSRSQNISRASNPSSWRYFPAHLCPVDNCGTEQFFFGNGSFGPIPLPEMVFTYREESIPGQIGRAEVSVVGSQLPGDSAFTMGVNPLTSSTTPDLPVNFLAEISSNFDDDFILMAYVPAGWKTTVGEGGSISIQPAPGTPTGDYTIQMVAQSKQHPELFDSVQHTVVVTGLDTVILTINPEPNITIPMEDASLEAVSNQTNDGEAEIGGAAYAVELSNPGQTPHTYDVNVTGPPAGWVWFNGTQSTNASVTLPAGGSTTIGLYLQPPDGTVPTPGTSFSVNVSASSGSISDSDSVPFTMPDQPFNFVDIQPTRIYLGTDSSVDFTIQMANVGNGGGSFPITVVLPPINASISGLPSSVPLAVDETFSLTATLETTNISPGSRFPVVIGSQAPGSYTQYALAEVQIISTISEVVFSAADKAANTCTSGEPGLSGALESLAYAMVHLETSCAAGGCDPILQDQVVNATDSVALYASTVSSELVSVDVLVEAANDLTSHNDDAEILSDLENISAAVTDLDNEICVWSQHKPALQWTPYYGAALQNETTNFSLELTNLGTEATTYALTITLPGSVDAGQWTVAPGDSQTFDYPLTIADMDLYDLNASVSVVGQNSVSAQAAAQLNVVDRYVQLTAVTPDPNYVETGTSATTLHIEVNNIANIPWDATARTVIQAPGGGTSHTNDIPLTLLVGALHSYELETVDTSGWAEGIYTITVELLDQSENLIPNGSGYGHLGVGQLLGASHLVSQIVVPPGEATVTTKITTELLVSGIVTDVLNSQAFNLSVNNLTNSGISDSPAESLLPSAPRPLATRFLDSTYAITRTQDTSATIVYSGSWTTVNNIFATHTNDGSYAVSSTPGDTATFVFTGTWVHLGLSKTREGGQAEILIDGISHGSVDLYHPGIDCFSSICLTSLAYDNLSSGTHTLEIVVTDSAHPNATGQEIKLDYIDTWDGTVYPDGTFEQDDPRIWKRPGVWGQINEPAASGGSFMNDGGVSNNSSVWFPFTGDSASFVGLARYDSHRVRVSVDGVRQGDVLIYSGTPISRTYSFSGFGPGPHVMQVSAFRDEPNIDAFITPAVGPDYDPPKYSGLVRYEEDHPALSYNGYDFDHRPGTWSSGNAGQASEFSYAQSATISDTVSLTFDGSWANIGLRTRNRGGLADVSIDGVSYGTINAYSPGEDVVSYRFPVITGTHRLTITVLGQSDPSNSYNQVYLDYIEIWDSTPVSDSFQNALNAAESGRIHTSSSASDGTHPNAIQGDFVNSGLPNSIANVWYSFVGDSFTFYGLTQDNNADAEIYVDDVLIDSVSLDYPFSVQPYAFNYAGFGPGAHSVRVHNLWEMRVDGFAANQPDLPYQPIAEWWDDTSAGTGAPLAGTVGIAAGMAVGDINNDGVTEIVVTADDMVNFGSMFVYRGDGADTGDGDPILWSHDFGGGVFRTWVGSPTIAELDGQPGAEIVVAAGNQLYAFHDDGTTYWITDTVSIFETLSSPAIGNLDLDPEPEIVVNLGDTLEVRDHEGFLLWSTVYPAHVNPPVLADLTGDGLLDILVTGWDDDVILYDFNNGSPQIVWSEVLTSSMGGTFGAPATADIDGQQPGGDPGPEVALAHNGALTVLNGEDGSLVWTTPLDPGNPGGVSIADLDGDGEIELVTGMKYDDGVGEGRLYTLNADGSVLWWTPAYDSTSANNASTLDLDGDGVYEVAWNGRQQGFTIFSGLDGSVIFNEPLANSLTGTDYPLIADVDNDGQAEVVVAALGGLRVFGNSSAWTEARPLWNQHSYHITNVNDDLSIPTSEPDSWEVHNTYRTQTPQRYPMPVYAISLTHIVGFDGVSVLTDTFNITPDVEVDPIYGWEYAQSWESPLITRTFDSQLENLEPGETRLIAQGTIVDYVLPSGQNHLELPPLYVSVPHMVGIDPVLQTAGAGASAIFTLTLVNPSSASSTYTPTVALQPGLTFDVPTPVVIPAHSEINLPLIVTVDQDAEATTRAFAVEVATEHGAADQVAAELHILGPVVTVELTPATQSLPTGEPADYNLEITNLEGVPHTYDLSADGLGSVSMPAQISVGANSSEVLSITAQAVSEGPNPFTVIAAEEETGARAQYTAIVIGEGFQQVSIAIQPEVALSGPGVPTPLRVIVANLGTSTETFNMNATVPANWSSALTLFGQPVSSVMVAPGANNAIELQLMVTPPNDAAPNNYDISVTAQSQSAFVLSPESPLASGSGSGIVQVGDLGVDILILSGPPELLSDGDGTWQIQVTNTGSQADTYDLSVFGLLAAFAEIDPAVVTLNPGQSQTVQVTASGFDFILAGETLVGAYAQSQTQEVIQDEAVAVVTIFDQQDVELAWQPSSQSIDGTVFAAFTLAITNTGNVQTTFDLTASASPSAGIDLPTDSLILSPQSTATMLVQVTVSGSGTHSLTATAESDEAQNSATATLTVEGVGSPLDGLIIYLPLVPR